MGKSSLGKFAVFLALFCWLLVSLIDENSPEFKTTPALIERVGYKVETHTVETPDGFSINIHRILRKSNNSHGSPVALQHGLMSSSETWVLRGSDKDLAFQLSNQGFDVWLLNSRSNHHAWHNSGVTHFNDFSFHEMAAYDLPSSIDYILKRTKRETMSLIGHSMGTTSFFAALSMKPEYNNKINHFVGMAPFLILQPLQKSSQQALIGGIINGGAIGEFFLDKIYSRTTTLRRYFSYFVYSGHLEQYAAPYAWSFFEKFGGKDTTCRNTIPISVLMANYPSGLGFHTIMHLSWNILRGAFAMRNFGKEENLRKYNAAEPPIYDISQVNVTMSLYYGEKDVLTPPKTSIETSSKFPSVRRLVEIPGCNHGDLIWSEDVVETAHKTIVHELLKANTKL